MKYNERNLEEVLEEHEKYIQTEGIEGSIADFSDASLTGVTFINFLKDADFIVNDINYFTKRTNREKPVSCSAG